MMLRKSLDDGDKRNDPASYNITIDEKEICAINDVISSIDKSVISKKLSGAKYTLLKSSDDLYFVIGAGQRGENINAFFGRGATARVKAAAPLKKNEQQHYQLLKEVYAVKIYDRFAIDLEEQKREANFYNKMYGYGEIIIGDSQEKIYFLMTHLPGIDLVELNFALLSINEFSNIIIAVVKAISEMHKKGIYHNDIKSDNIRYNMADKTAYMLDFGLSTFINESGKDHHYFKNMLQDMVSSYLKKHLTNFDFAPLTTKLGFSKTLDEFTDALVDKVSGKFIVNDDNIDELTRNLNQILLSIRYDSNIYPLNSQLLSSLSEDKLINLLYKCIVSNDAENFSKVLPFCNDISLRDNGLSLLETALAVNNPHFIQPLIRIPLNLTEIFFIAIRTRDFARVKQLVGNGISINLLDANNATGLMHAAKNNAIDIALYLIDNGADVNLQSKNGWTAIMVAALLGQSDLVSRLLQKGANINLQTNDGQTALINAIEKGHTDIAVLLIENGANYKIKESKDGFDAKELAEIRGDTKVLAAIASLDSYRP